MTLTEPLPDGLSQREIDAEVAKAQASAAPTDHPPRDYPPYRSSHLRHPKQPLIRCATRRRWS